MLNNNVLLPQSGADFIRSIHNSIPDKSGVYKMLNQAQQVIYIGKAKNLKQRLYTYSLKTNNPRIFKMIQNVYKIDWIITNSEYDALLLESNLIKQAKPRFNILLKDDRTFPFIKIDITQKFPRVLAYRSKQATPTTSIFGPFASTYYIKENIKLLQQIFQLRNCTDNFFNNREKPCILYQLKRCSAPCVHKINQADYKNSIKQAISFLQGNNLTVKENLIQAMHQVSQQQNFERAIVLRERIKLLQNNHHKQSTILKNQDNADFIVLMEHNDSFIYNIFMFRYGYNHGSIHFVVPILQHSLEEAMRAFLMQFYHKRDIPKNIYINIPINNTEIMSDINQYLSTKANRQIQVKLPVSEVRKNILKIVIENTIELTKQKEQLNNKWLDNFTALAKLFNLKAITRIELYDNSHLYGTFPLGAMVCANPSGFNKKEYRTFHIKGTTFKHNDDYAIFNETLTRRFSKLNPENTPELIFIDGGKGQLNVALKLVKEFNLDIKIVGIAKGINRNAGEETLYLENQEPITLARYSSNLHFIQMLRNEVHRFAIHSLRKRKLKSLTISEINSIPSIGIKRKKDLLNYFGTIDNIKKATVSELIQVKGINNAIANEIFNWFH